MASLALGLGVAASAVLVAATPAQAVTGWDRCTNGYSCYFRGTGGTGELWAAPSNGWHPLPFRVLSVWNRGGGKIEWYVSGVKQGWVTSIGYKGSNGALNADEIYVQP